MKVSVSMMRSKQPGPMEKASSNQVSNSVGPIATVRLGWSVTSATMSEM